VQWIVPGGFILERAELRRWKGTSLASSKASALQNEVTQAVIRRCYLPAFGSANRQRIASPKAWDIRYVVVNLLPQPARAFQFRRQLGAGCSSTATTNGGETA
jgi:hypothetical protein